jgi:DNA-binding CsgD family transcriptional regulator
MQQVDRSVHTQDDWAAFENQFQRVHPDYIRILSERYPVLSRTELRVCALLKVGLATKEIARLLNVSVRDIENHRYRIRKKLAIGAGGDLATFLAAV